MPHLDDCTITVSGGLRKAVAPAYAAGRIALMRVVLSGQGALGDGAGAWDTRLFWWGLYDVVARGLVGYAAFTEQRTDARAWMAILSCCVLTWLCLIGPVFIPPAGAVWIPAVAPYEPAALAMFA